MQKDFPVTEVTEKVFIYLDEEDTKIGEIISKHKDYWYEIVLNPDTVPQTIIGYDEDGAKVFRLFPESNEIDDNYDPKPEDFPVVDEELDMTSPRPVSNRAIACAVATILDTCERTNNAVAKLHVTPEMFGAIGDGVADDTEAVQDAILTGGTVQLNNTYRIKSKISVNKDNIHIVGGTLILDDQTAEEFVLEISGSNILVEGVKIKHIGYENATNKQAQNGMKVYNCDFVTFRDCDFEAVEARINGVLDFYNKWSNVTIDNCRFVVDTFYDGEYHSGGIWFRDFYGNGCENLNIINCTFDSKSKDEVVAIWSTSSNVIKNVVLSNNKFTGSEMAHMVTVCCDNVNIIGCEFFSKATLTVLKCFLDSKPATNCLISDCLFVDNLTENSAVKMVSNEKGTDKIDVKNCRFRGRSFGSNRCAFFNCNIDATENRSNNSHAEFYSCKIKNVQVSNQFIHVTATIRNCEVETSGQFIQPLYESVFTILGNVITSADSNFLVSGAAKSVVMMNNDFRGSKVPDIYTLSAKDVVMGNRFAVSPNPNNSNPTLGWDTNVIG